MFTEKERRVYGPYWNGQANIYGDPLRIHRMLVHELGGDPNAVLADYKSEMEPAQFEAANRLAKAAVIVFGLMPFDTKTGLGCLEDDCMTVLIDYMKWCGKKKETSESMPTGSPATATPQSQKVGGDGPTIGGLGIPASTSRAGLPSG